MSHDLTALYERLSHDDELQSESNSISNQKTMLEDYAEKNGFAGIRHFTEIKYPYKWTSSTIAHILSKHEYLGHTVNFKTRKHFKDKKSHYVDKDQWLIFEDTHAPIINQETLDSVQRIRGRALTESRQRNRQQSRTRRREEELRQDNLTKNSVFKRYCLMYNKSGERG